MLYGNSSIIHFRAFLLRSAECVGHPLHSLIVKIPFSSMSKNTVIYDLSGPDSSIFQNTLA